MPSPKEIDLAEALERDEIEPYFQPLVELTTGKLMGFEVLSRWNHPVLGMISPDNFIPLAEETGLIGLLTEKILRRAFVAASVLPDPLSLSVNISALLFRDRDLPMKIEQAAVHGRFAFHRLILEVTESALVDNLEQAREISMRLKDLGIRLALDDFGTGYSSLHHLQALPFDELKIDASFIRSMDSTRESRKIAAAVVGLGHSLGLITVAEGIETQAQAEMLLWLGCDFGQGWLFGRPVPAEELPHIVSRENLSPQAEAPSGHASVPSVAARLEVLPAQRLAQLQAIYDGAPVGLCFLDTNMRYISLNKRLAEMNGVPIADHIGRRVGDMYPEMFKIVEPYVRMALQGESLSGIEATYSKPAWNGGRRTFLLSYQPAWDEANEVIGVSVSVVDITGRKLAEEVLQESEDHYRHTVELNPQIPWTMDADGMSIEISRRWVEVTGLALEQSRGHGWLDALHPEDAARVLELFDTVLHTGEPIDMEYRVNKGNGEWRWMRTRGLPRRDAAGKIIRWYGSVEDIDDRKKMEQALIESEALLKAVFDAVPVGIVIAEAPSGRIVISNPQAETIFRRPVITADHMEDYRKAGAFHSDGRPMEPSEYPLARAIVTGEPVSPEELLYRRVDGSEGWVSATAAPVRGRDGEILGGVVALLDVGDLKREKQALLDRISELERQIRELGNSPVSTELRSS
jgi:PAS domain S-box-containing protein